MKILQQSLLNEKIKSYLIKRRAKCLLIFLILNLFFLNKPEEKR